jgi:hypothetical protein
MFQTFGNLTVDGRSLRGGFMAATPSHGLGMQQQMQQAAAATPPSVRAELSPELRTGLDAIQRGEFTGDPIQFSLQMAQEIEGLRTEFGDVIRAITSSTSNLPVRENLEAPAIVLVPQDTPFRNMLPRVSGSGLASAWRQVTSLGGGWGTSLDQPGGSTAKRVFYAETGAPAEFTTEYASKTASYKLIGAYGSVTNFAAAAGASYGNLKASERNNCLANTFLNEENALINGDATSTAAPWGDGTNALAFNGILNLVTTTNGTPSAHISSSVGAFTLDHFNAQLTKPWKQGARNLWTLMNSQEIMSLQAALRHEGEPYRLNVTDQANAVMGFRVAEYVHPISGERVKIIVSRFLAAGTILYGGMTSPDGTHTLDIEVLPQASLPPDVQRPEGTHQAIQGYTVTELAASLTSPDVQPFMINVYEVLRCKNALMFAKSTGVTAWVAPTPPSSGGGGT